METETGFEPQDEKQEGVPNQETHLVSERHELGEGLLEFPSKEAALDYIRRNPMAKYAGKKAESSAQQRETRAA